MDIKGTLYICPTPIGNLEDITLRVLRILKQVDLIACEDTRVTQKLLNRYEIKTKLISYHKFSEKKKSIYLVNLLNEGKNIALVSDAGTPLISDPGAELIKAVFADQLKIVPLPGPSSVITALSATPSEEIPFVFTGFLPKSRKEKEIILLKYLNINIAAFESPNRLLKTFEEIFELTGNRTITVARELSKIYEEIKTGSVSDLIDYYSKKPPKGEIVLIIKAQKEQKNKPDKIELTGKIKILKKQGYSVSELSKIISLLYKYPKKEVYSLAVELFGE